MVSPKRRRNHTGMAAKGRCPWRTTSTRGCPPICIKLSRLVHHHCLPLCTTLAGRPPSCEQLLTGFALPFLFAQQHRHVTAEVTPQGLYRALLDGMGKAVFTLQPQKEFMETQ